MSLDKFFESEKKIMIRYYADKMKKNKKLKAMVIGLQSMDAGSNAKYKVLRNYYENVVVQ